MDHSLQISFQLRKTKTNKKGLAPINLRITIDGRRAELSTHRRLNPNNWDPITCRPYGNTDEIIILNNYLDSLKTKVQRQYNILESIGSQITLDSLTNRLTGKNEKKHIKKLKKVINLAIANEWLHNDPFKKHKCIFKLTNRGYLTSTELQTLEEKTFTIPRLQKVLDIFIFCCYTGLSQSDVEKLSPSDISIGIDGEKWIIIYRKKTDSRSPIPLLPQAMAIIEKYKNNHECIVKNRLLPVNSNQRMNGYLKEISDNCGIEKRLTMHLARHTFATTVTLANGVPIETVSKMLGHTSIKTTQIYSKVVDTKISEDMQELKTKITDKKSVKRAM